MTCSPTRPWNVGNHSGPLQPGQVPQARLFGARTYGSSGNPQPVELANGVFRSRGDTITARELVGAITGEAGVAGDQIGKVEIRDTFSVVEVSSEVAERVIRSLNGTSLRGRSLRVDYDRKPATQRRTLPARRTRPPRQ